MEKVPPGSPRVMPPVLASGVVRPRLDELLTAAAKRATVTLVSAGAGSGKTTAVARWAQAGGFPATIRWVNLDAQDNEVTTLRLDIFAALAGTAADLDHIGQTDSLAAGAARILERSRADAPPVMLILDDVQEIAARQPLEELRQLAEGRAPGLRLVLVSRSDPPLRLQRWRIDGSLAEIRARDLAFRRDEAAQLFRQYGIDLSAPQMDALMTRTQGWAAGLRLAAMSLDPSAVEEGIAGFAGDQHSVAEYLIGEVLDHLPDRERGLLLRTSVVEEITGPLAEELSGDEGAVNVLRKLADDNELLFGLGPDRLRFRYHPLLHQLLLHQFVAESPDAVRTQHRLAAQWFCVNREPMPAVRHAVLARDAALLRRVLATCAVPLVFSPHLPELATALRSEPNGNDGLRAAVCHVAEGDYPAAACEIDRARSALRKRSGGVAVAEHAALTVLHLVIVARQPDAGATILAAENALHNWQTVPAALAPVVSRYRAIALGYLGSALLWAGRPVQAEGYLFEAARQALALDLPAVRAMCLGHLALLRAGAGALHSAEQYAQTARGIRANGWLIGESYLALAYAGLIRGDAVSAGRNLSELSGDADGLVALAAGLLEAHLLHMRGASTKAAAVLEEVRQEALRKGAVATLLDDWSARLGADLTLQEGGYESMLLWPSDRDARAQIRYARAELGLNRLEAAQARLRRLLAEPDPLTGVEVWSTYAAVQHALHNDDAAVRAMGRALTAAEPEELVEPFVSFGAACLAVLLLCQDVAAGPSTFADKVIAAIEENETPASLHLANAAISELIEPLTDRELVVLRYLSTMRANTEIGERLFVTVNTVKAHLKSVYRKLGVNSRRAAVERARELHLF